MKLEKQHVLLVIGLMALALFGACKGDDAKDDAQPQGGGSTAGVGAGTSGTGAGTAGTSSGGGSGEGGGTAGTGVVWSPDAGSIPSGFGDAGDTSGDPCDYENEEVVLDADLVIAAGESVHVCPGVTFKAAKDVKISVSGELIVDGSADKPVTLGGNAAMPRSWHGLVLESGGKLKLAYAKVSGALYGLFANAGSSYLIDRTLFDTSFKNAVLQADGTVTNSTFLASIPPTIAITEAVSVDDPNGSLTIMDASPTISNCKFDGASAFTDLIRVGGEASPTFDHISVSDAHCGFHTSGGVNTSIRVTNSIIEKMAYGVMAFTTKPIFEDCVFRNNSNDVGLCNGATKDNTPVLMSNNYPSGKPTVDASCFMIDTDDPSPAATANPTAGPSGL